jgi:hypothetical protein
MDEPEQIMKRYLLGELSESEQSALEEKYFTDPQFFNQILKAESELVDTYVRGQLSNEVRERFEQSYMAHPARSERVKFAAALATKLNQTEESETSSEQPVLQVSWWQRLLAALRGQRPTLRFSLALATLLIMLGGIWFFIESQRRQRELSQTQAASEAQQRREPEQSQPPANESRRAEELATEQERVERNPQQMPRRTPTPTSGSAPRSVYMALTVGGVRSGDTGQTPTLVIPPGTTQARLQLLLKDDDYPGYHAALQMVGGAEIFSQRGVKPRRGKTGASFIFTLPARKLSSGDYILTLKGINPDGEVDDLSKSLFRVEKK